MSNCTRNAYEIQNTGSAGGFASTSAHAEPTTVAPRASEAPLWLTERSPTAKEILQTSCPREKDG